MQPAGVHAAGVRVTAWGLVRAVVFRTDCRLIRLTPHLVMLDWKRERESRMTVGMVREMAEMGDGEGARGVRAGGAEDRCRGEPEDCFVVVVVVVVVFAKH